MPLSGLIALASFGLGVVSASAADATRPIDYTQRNAPFVPSGTVAPQKQAPEKNAALQEKRVEKNVREKETSPLGERRAPVDVTEGREKKVREKDVRQPDVIDHKTSAYNHRPAAISTQGDTKKPPTVAKYQDSLGAASATNMARFPALDQSTAARINRFVFRKNPPDVAAVTTEHRTTPAAGGSPLIR